MKTNVKRILKGLFLLYVLIELLLGGKLSIFTLALLLIAAGLIVLHERFWPLSFAAFLQAAPAVAGIHLHPAFALLLCPLVLDLAYQKLYIWLALIPAAAVFFRASIEVPSFLLLCALAGLSGYIISDAETKALALRQGLDQERRLRYDLEEAKGKLLQAAGEAARLAETTERNRIAREVHDSVGHKLAGILIRLQAAAKLRGRDEGKAGEILQESIANLAGAVVLLRETVHNLKPRENLGVDYLKAIIAGFGFCPVEVSFAGDFNQLPAGHLEILGANLREALTNAAKHSHAGRIEIKIETNESYTRLYYKDDGVGCRQIKEGLGLSGMRERLANLGGSLSVSAEEGFLIVCVLPREGRERLTGSRG